MKEDSFLCTMCLIVFETSDYAENPVFLADMVTTCPNCGAKCWTWKDNTSGGKRSRLAEQFRVSAAKTGKVTNKYSEFARLYPNSK